MNLSIIHIISILMRKRHLNRCRNLDDPFPSPAGTDEPNERQNTKSGDETIFTAVHVSRGSFNSNYGSPQYLSICSYLLLFIYSFLNWTVNIHEINCNSEIIYCCRDLFELACLQMRYSRRSINKKELFNLLYQPKLHIFMGNT